MKQKPKGPRYRNLVARGEVIYFERVVHGERERVTLDTGDWNEAAATRDLWLLRRAQAAVAKAAVPTFGELAARYLREGMAHLAPATREDREKLLGEGKRLTAYFGAKPADEITRSTLLEFWLAEVEARGRARNTGKQYLAALAGVFGLAVDLELIEASPVDAFRGTLRRKGRTKDGRARAAGSRNVRPIETPEQLRAFVAASRASENRRDHVADMLLLDAGLRLGEAVGLRWSDVEFGDADGTKRSLAVCEALARGRHVGPPKSGRARTVTLSRRLRALLREWYIESGRPALTARVLAGLEDYPYRLHFDAVIRAAGIPRHTPKDLRDTFASQLLTAGVQLGYIGEQLGHSDVATTARHYARWAGDDAREPMQREPGEVPADLLARIEAIESPHESPQSDAVDAS